MEELMTIEELFRLDAFDRISYLAKLPKEDLEDIICNMMDDQLQQIIYEFDDGIIKLDEEMLGIE